MSVLLAATLAAAVQGSFTVGDRSELRLRTEPAADGAGGIKNRIVADVDTTPSALLRLWSRRTEIDVSYTPRYTLRDYAENPTAEILQRMGLAIAMRPDRLSTFVIGEDFAYGRTSFVTLGLGQTSTTAPPPGAPPVERLPLTQTLQYVSSRTFFTVGIVASRRVRYGAYLDYSLSGGTDATSKAILPLQTAPRGELTLEVLVSRRDALVTTLRASRLTFGATDLVPSINVTFLEQLEGVRHRFGRSTDGTLSVGVTETASRISGDKPTWKVYPVAEAVLRHLLAPDHIEGRAYVRFAPVVDRLTGNLDYQVQGSLIGLWTPGSLRHGFVVRSLVGVAESLPPSKDRALSVIIVEAALGYRTSARVLFEVGARTISQRLGGTDPAPRFYAGFVTATFGAEPLRF